MFSVFHQKLTIVGITLAFSSKIKCKKLRAKKREKIKNTA